MGNVRSPVVLYNTDEQGYFTKGVIGATTFVQPKMEVPDSKTTSNNFSNEVRIFRIEEVEFCTAFVREFPVNKICGLMTRDNVTCKTYKTHYGIEKGDV